MAVSPQSPGDPTWRAPAGRLGAPGHRFPCVLCKLSSEPCSLGLPVAAEMNEAPSLQELRPQRPESQVEWKGMRSTPTGREN